jgi:hypothetical protein
VNDEGYDCETLCVIYTFLEKVNLVEEEENETSIGSTNLVNK